MRIGLTPAELKHGDWNVQRKGDVIVVHTRFEEGTRTDEYTPEQADALIAACDKDAGVLIRFAGYLQEARYSPA